MYRGIWDYVVEEWRDDVQEDEDEERMPRYIERDRIEADWTCPRKRYWSTEYEGRGIAPASTSIEFALDSAIANAIGRFFRDEDPYTRLSQDLDHLPVASGIERQEYLGLGLGLVHGYLKRIWPRWAQQYKVLGAEVECTLPIPGAEVEIMVRPDLVVEDNETGAIYYIEYKTSGAKGKPFIARWSQQAQIHVGVAALERKLQRPVAGVIIQGLLKGYAQRGTRYSPFCYVYSYAGRPGISSSDEICYEYHRGYERRPVWDLEGGIDWIIRDMPDDVLYRQFPATPPIAVRQNIIENFLKQQRFREAAIDLWEYRKESADAPDMFEEIFPQHFTQCDPAVGHPCPFKDACFNPSVRRDPIGSGLYTWRVPHHEPESQQFEVRYGGALKPVIRMAR